MLLERLHLKMTRALGLKTLQVADYLVDRAIQEGRPLGAPQLMKQLYLCQGWHLARYNAPLFPDSFEIWATGPVVPHAYEAYRHLGAGGREKLRQDASPAEISVADKAHIDAVISKITGQTPADIYFLVMRTFGPASRTTPASWFRKRSRVANEAIKVQFRLQPMLDDLRL